MNIQPLTLQDLPFTRQLQPDGWGDITASLMEYCLQQFCRPIKVVDQNIIVGLGTAILHQGSAWLAHIIVHESYRGHGIGAKIVNHLMSIAIQNGSSSINLIATDLGLPVYVKAGFRKVGAYKFLKRQEEWGSQPLPEQLQVAKSAYHHQILHLDFEINGERRTELIENHLKQGIIFAEDGLVEGYYFPQLGQGPIYAKTERAGLALMALKYSTVDTAVLPVDNLQGIQFLTKNGFVAQDTTAIRMTYGEDTHWRPTQIFSRIGGNHG